MLIILHLPPDPFSVPLSPVLCTGRLTSTTASPTLPCFLAPSLANEGLANEG